MRCGNIRIIQYDEQGTEKVVGVAQSIKWNPPARLAKQKCQSEGGRLI